MMLISIYSVFLSFQVASIPKSVNSLLKMTICPKKKFPYGADDDITYYDPGCVENMYVCPDFCGRRCKGVCQQRAHEGVCLRGKLPENFLFCPMRDEKDTNVKLPYSSYGLVVDKAVKVGKTPFTKMEEKIKEKPFLDFLEAYKENFEAYGKHKTEAWLLNTSKNVCSDKRNQPGNMMYMVSDFAQNLKLDKKNETSEEYFHKKQIAIFASVSTVNIKESEHEGEQHTISQITSSDCKYVYHTLDHYYKIIDIPNK